MAYGFLDIASTPSVKAAQEANGSRGYFAEFKGKRQFNKFGAAEAAFIHERDSFYIATVSETGWPYIQHRGGPPGFLRVLDDKTLAFADFHGNRQCITLGNASANDRVSLFLMDYPGRRRLKIYARIEAKEPAANPALTEQVVPVGDRAKPERVFLLHLEAFDWIVRSTSRRGSRKVKSTRRSCPFVPESRRPRPKTRSCGKNSPRYRNRCLSSTSICSAEGSVTRWRARGLSRASCGLRFAYPLHGSTGSARRDHHDLDLVVGRSEFGLNGRPRWRIARRHPGIPDRVHLSEIRHVSYPDIGRE